jgi:hypothetical protein
MIDWGRETKIKLDPEDPGAPLHLVVFCVLVGLFFAGVIVLALVRGH